MALDALGEATSDQQAELQRQLAAQPALAQEHAAMKELAGDMEDVAMPLPPPMAVPTSVLKKLEEARLQILAKATAAGAQAAGAANVTSIAGTGRPVEAGRADAAASRPLRPSTGKFSFTRLVARAAIIALLAAPIGWWLSQRVGQVIATASPALAPTGETSLTEPTLVWENATDQDYNIWILPEGADQLSTDPLFVARNVRSPLPFSEFAPGKGNPEKSATLKPATRYLALVCLAGGGRHAGVLVPFQTTTMASGAPMTPADAPTALKVAREALAAGRPGDGLMILAPLTGSGRSLPEVTALEAELKDAVRKLPAR